MQNVEKNLWRHHDCAKIMALIGQSAIIINTILCNTFSCMCKIYKNIWFLLFQHVMPIVHFGGKHKGQTVLALFLGICM